MHLARSGPAPGSVAPAPLARRVLTREALDAGRVVLPEAAYTAALGAVIERDFFPDLGRLSAQLGWLRALQSGDADGLAAAAAAAAAAGSARSDAVVGSPAVSAGGGSGFGGGGGGGGGGVVRPGNTSVLRAGGGGGGGRGADAGGGRHALAGAAPSGGAPSGGATGDPRAVSIDGGDEDSAFARSSWGAGGGAPARAGASGAPSTAAAAAGGAAVLDGLRLDAFQRTFVSEDTSSFGANLAAAEAARAARAWWTHVRAGAGGGAWRARRERATHGALVAGAPGTLLLRSHNDVGVDDGDGGDGGGGGEGEGVGGGPGGGSGGARGRVRAWRYRPRNALFFPPTLAASNDVSGVTRPLPDPDLPLATLADGWAAAPGGGRVEGPGPAATAGLLARAAAIEDAAAGGGAAWGGAPARRAALAAAGTAPYYSLDDMDVGSVGVGVGGAAGAGAGAGARGGGGGAGGVGGVGADVGGGGGERAGGGAALPRALAALDLALPAALRPTARAIAHARTRLPSAVLAAALAPPPARAPPAPPGARRPAPDFRGHALLATPLIVPGSAADAGVAPPAWDARAGGGGGGGGPREVITIVPPITWGRLVGEPVLLDAPPPPPPPPPPTSAAALAAAFGVAPLSGAGGAFALPRSAPRDGVRDALLERIRAGKRPREGGDEAGRGGWARAGPPARGLLLAAGAGAGAGAGAPVSAARDALRAAVTETRASVLAGGGGGLGPARTPVFAAAGTPSVLAGGWLGGGAGGRGSVVGRRAAAGGPAAGGGGGGASVVSRTSTHARRVRETLARLPPAAQRLAREVAAQAAAARAGRPGAGGDLAGAFG